MMCFVVCAAGCVGMAGCWWQLLVVWVPRMQRDCSSDDGWTDKLPSQVLIGWLALIVWAVGWGGCVSIGNLECM